MGPNSNCSRFSALTERIAEKHKCTAQNIISRIFLGVSLASAALWRAAIRHQRMQFETFVLVKL